MKHRDWPSRVLFFCARTLNKYGNQMTQISTMTESVPNAVRHYLGRTADIVSMLAHESEAKQLLAIRLAPDMLETGIQFAVAIRFAARALCPPSGLEVPNFPDEITCNTLLAFASEISAIIAPIRAADLTLLVSHTAGNAELIQLPAEYISSFALPNMIFHLSMGYAGLRHGGFKIGKADFDGFHIY
jgi:hypothetical protein